jgi:tetratricopeptide (TPR) repeat protein
LAICLSNLGQAYLNKKASHENDLDEAEHYIDRAFQIRQTIYPYGHPALAQSFIQLGELRSEQGKFDEARDNFERAQDILTNIPGADANLFIECWVGIARSYIEERIWEQVLPYLTQIFEIQKTNKLPNNYGIGVAYMFLAGYYTNKGDNAAAESPIRQALQIWQDVLGPEHHEVGVCLLSCARILTKLDQLDEAEQMKTRAQAILGNNEPPPE